METPLLDALRDYAKGDPARFHMPGHKGVAPGALKNLFPLDVTELPDTGDLYAGGDVIARAEGLWGELFGFPTCQFLTGGSTQGIHTALLLCARRGRDILVDRCAHRAVHNAMALFDLLPAYLSRPQDRPLTPTMLRRGLELAREHGRDIKTVCITSPTYYGVLSDVPALSAVAHEFGTALVIDGAHGCHLPFLGQAPFRGADLVICSAHKTMPVLGQGALLFAGEDFSPEEARRAASVCGTSSPSYAVMASMDLARAEWTDARGRRKLEELCRQIAHLRAVFPSFSGPEMDPMRLTALVPGGLGRAWKKRLEERGVFPEMADRDHLVFLLSPSNSRRHLKRLEKALEALYAAAPAFDPVPCPPAPLPPVRLTPRQALLAPTARRVLAESEGEICAQQIAPYPPGIPVVAPGEEITKKGLAYLTQVGYNMDKEIQIVCPREAEGGGEP